MDESTMHPSQGLPRSDGIAEELPVPGGDRALAEDWALVLASQGVATRVVASGQGFALEMAKADVAKAEMAIAAYLLENRRPAASSLEEKSVLGEPNLAGIGVGLLLLAVYALSTGHRDGHLLIARGSADAELILTGEWWRCVTALCLHSNLSHLLGNTLAGLYFIGAVCRMLGTGLGLILVLIAGAIGNLLNALAHADLHRSVGASTAVFGAIGILAGLALVRRHRAGLPGRQRWIPIGAALGLLALLGTGGLRVDVWAHLFGLTTGFALGSACIWLSPAAIGIQRRLALVSLLTVTFCWSLALR